MTETARKTCRLCGQSGERIIHSLKEKVITDFLINAVVRLNNVNKNEDVCSICYAKAKLVVDFIALVNKAQNFFENKLNQPPEKDPFSDTNFVAIKQEENDDSNLVCEINEEENSFSENDDSDWFSLQQKSKSSKYVPKKEKILSQKNSFRCGNCKKEHKKFSDLEAHIVKCFKESEQIKCYVCDKQCETRKKMYTHMEVHKRIKRQRKRTTKPKEENTAANLDCSHCEKSFNSQLALKNHMKVHSIKDKSKDVDMNGMFLENADCLM